MLLQVIFFDFSAVTAFGDTGSSTCAGEIDYLCKFLARISCFTVFLSSITLFTVSSNRLRWCLYLSLTTSSSRPGFWKLYLSLVMLTLNFNLQQLQFPHADSQVVNSDPQPRRIQVQFKFVEHLRCLKVIYVVFYCWLTAQRRISRKLRLQIFFALFQPWTDHL